MKAPNKIYINVHPLGVDYSIVPIPDFGGVEYIRKDALLEWARAGMPIDEVFPELQQEQPDNEDIDKVAQELYEHLYELKRRNSVPTNLYDKQEIIDIWKAGIEYGRNHPKQERPEVDLEKELIQWHKSHFKKADTYEKYSGFYLENSSQLDLARHFYELGRARKEEC